MNVMLITPPQILRQHATFSPGVVIPNGLAYIAAVLEKEGINVSILDAMAEGRKRMHKFAEDRNYVGLTYDEVAERVREKNPDWVGITCSFTSQSRSSHKVAEAIKRQMKDMPIVFGGNHTTVVPEMVLSDPNVNIAALGEGEYTSVDLCKAIEAGGTPEALGQVAGIAFKKEGKIIYTKPRGLIANLDSLPFPARHLLPMEEYFAAQTEGDASRYSTKRMVPIFTSRGCPFNCTFCAGRKVTGQIFRPRSPENVVAEMEHVKEKYKVGEIHIEDDNFTFDKKRTERILDMMIGKKLGLDWRTPNAVRADLLDEPLLKKMKESGLVELSIAPESGDQEVITKLLHKNLSLKKVEEIVSACKKLGIRVNCFFIVGFPGETKENQRKTSEFSVKLRKMGAETYPQVNSVLPLYGSELKKTSEEMGALHLKDGKPMDLSFLDTDSLIETKDFNKEDLEKLNEIWKNEYRRYSLTDPNTVKARAKRLAELLRNKPKHAIRRLLDETIATVKIIKKQDAKY